MKQSLKTKPYYGHLDGYSDSGLVRLVGPNQRFRVDFGLGTRDFLLHRRGLDMTQSPWYPSPLAPWSSDPLVLWSLFAARGRL